MEGFGYGDIIVIGAIAAFIILRYRAMLGEQSGRDPSSIQPPAASTDPLEPVIRVAERERAKPAASAAPAMQHTPELEARFKAMKAVDAEFSPDEFLQGAKLAFEMVVKAFSTHDRETLGMLLDPAIFAKFEAVLKQQENLRQRRDTTLVAITECQITKAELRGRVAELTVAFTSEQIHLVRDESGNIIEGNPGAIETVVDEWNFTRELGSASPNWLISGT